ncbi:MAG: TIGR02996 domain-containing protein, partial [Proteobacteria bacterium]|nr:TIGR02996 domain-containing protein [Pseudomonadota bacterium]
MPRDFLAQIVAAPDDDAPRLVYSDWLIERGDPHGELIAIQCAIARVDAADGDASELRRLARRETQLLDAHRDGWTRKARAWVLGDYRFRRGFIDTVKVRDVRDVHLAAAVLDDEPLLRGVIVHAVDRDQVLALATSAWRDRLRAFATDRLAAYEPTHARALHAVVESPFPLDELVLEFDGRMAMVDGQDVIRRVAACNARQPLRAFAMRRHRHLGAAAAALARLPHLTSLALEGADLQHDHIVAIATALPGLRALDLSENYGRFQAAKLDLTAVLAALPALAHLRLAKMGLEDAQAIAIAG